MIEQGSFDMDLSIVIPVYAAPGLLSALHARVEAALEPLNCAWELILVNDCCPEGSWEIIQELAGKDSRVVGVDLSRNFGQHAAISAGLSLARGKRVVVMDCDLQDRPEEIPALYNKSLEGFEVVLARRVHRKDSFIKKNLSRIFYSALSYLVGQKYDSTVANFGCYEKKVIDAVLAMGDKARCFPIFVKWVGFNTTAIEVAHGERELGKSAYTLRKSLNLAIDMMLSFSDKPLRLVIHFGIALSFFAGIVACLYFIGTILGVYEVEGWPSIVISIWFFSGVLIFINGIIGLYIAKIFEQTKDRPIYIVRERV